MTVIYLLRCPLTNDVRYVGKAKDANKRFQGHLKNAKNPKTQSHCANWIRKVFAAGKLPLLEIIYQVPEGESWQVAESRLIAEYLAAGSPLTNMTSGGDGFHDVDPISVARRVASRKKTLSDPVRRANLNEILKASHQTEEFRTKIRKAIIASWQDPVKRERYLAGAKDPQVRERRSNSLKKVFERDGHRERFSKKMKSIWSTPERKAEAKARAIKLHSNLEITARREASLKAAYQKPEVKARLAAAMAAVFKRPDVQAKFSVASKRRWQSEEYRSKILTKEKFQKNSKTNKARYQSDPAYRERVLALSKDPIRNKNTSERMKLRNADPNYRAVVHAPEVRARAAATLRATWARRKAAQQQESNAP